ncbi:barstar family protein [Streptomyces sp. CA-288835]|uniref:barstar family protein n=1 Tax=Streptomyces sp. CA-288835 TaxID=3240069 RepID=UPI003D94CA09
MSDLWWADEAPWVQVIPNDSTVSAVEALPPSGAVYSARMQGLEMTDTDGVFTQFYETLRLPNYFGWNFNALRDCLFDLGWLEATRYLLTIDNAEFILSEHPEERDIFLRILASSAQHWAAKPGFPEREKVTFHVVLLCAPDSCTELKNEVSGA